MADLKEKVLTYLDSIKNEFNALRIESRVDNIDKLVEQLKALISKVNTTNPKKLSDEAVIELFLDHLKVEPIKTIGNISLLDDGGLWAVKRMYKHNRWSDIARFRKSKYTEGAMFEKIKEIATIYSRKYTEIIELKIPTGQLVFANWFLSNDRGYAFDLPEELKYTDDYSINSKYGRQNCMDYMSKEYDLGYVQLGNTTAAIFKLNDDRVIIAPEYYYDDATDKDVEPPKDWEYLGDISCSVWRVEFADKETLDNNDNFKQESLEEEDSVSVQVSPGIWSAKNYYRDYSDKGLAKKFGYPIWVELNRVRDI